MCFARDHLLIPLENSFKMSCWNVNGLSKKSVFGNKLQNDEFLTQLNDSDINILSEIWGYDVEEIPGFDIVALSPPKKHNMKRLGRYSGGVLVAVKHFLTPYISLIKQTSDYIWCKLDKTFFHLEKDILLCSCYISPKDSPYFDPDTFSNLENDINVFKGNNFIVLAGDFNARTGTENDFITNDYCNFVPGDSFPLPTVVSPRKSFDNHINEQGKHLLEICKSLDLRILNGRCKGDSFGKITFHGNQGISTVDYIIVSHEILNIFQNFVVRQPTPFSDHCQLISWIKVNTPLVYDDNETQEEELFGLPSQFKWNETSKEKFISALQSTDVSQMIFEFGLLNLEEIGDVNESVDKFVKIIETAAKKSLQLTNSKKKAKKRHSQIWFDEECSDVRKRLRHISNKKHNNPLDEKTKLEYLSIRRQFKCLLRRKKQNHKDSKIDELINTRNPNQFWSTLKSMSNKTHLSHDSIIPAGKLYNHFQQLHSDPLNVDNIPKFQENINKDLKNKEMHVMQFDELDQLFTEEEIRMTVKTLKNKKSAGLDRIRSEMLKNGIQFLVIPLRKLFNFILSKGRFPDNWSAELISPIFKSGNKHNPSNYRGICVTSCLGKLFTALMNK